MCSSTDGRIGCFYFHLLTTRDSPDRSGNVDTCYDMVMLVSLIAFILYALQRLWKVYLSFFFNLKLEKVVCHE